MTAGQRDFPSLAEADTIRRQARAEANQRHVREQMARRYPALASALDAEVRKAPAREPRGRGSR